MKKVQKTLVSSVAALASVASIVTPAASVLAAEVTPLQHAQTEVTNAEKAKNFYMWNVAYAAVLKVPAAQQGPLLARLAAFESTVKTADVQAVLKSMDALIANKNLDNFYKTYALIEKVAQKETREYLFSELNTWGVGFVFTADVVKATSAINKAFASKLPADVDAAVAAIAELKVEANKTWCNTELEYTLKAMDLYPKAVAAADADTLTVTGYGLSKLKVADFTVAGNTVLSVTPNANGTSATVELQYKNLLNNEYTAKIGTKEFKYTYGYAATTVAVKEVTVDDNKLGQSLKLIVNGVETSVDTLIAAGYTVDFTAYDGSTNITSTFFSTHETSIYGTNVNHTGALAATLSAGNDYKVYASVAKESTVINSAAATIKVRNLDQTATTINKYTLLRDSSIEQVSTTLKVGETAQFTNLNVTANGDTFDTNAVVTNVTSSNPGVISVASGVLTANAPGTATITVGYGDISKTITFTVTNASRTVSSAKVSKTAFTLIKGNSTNVDIKTYDQFGDPMAGVVYLTHSAGLVTGPITLSTMPNALSSTVYASGDAKLTVAFTAVKAGAGSVYVTNGAGQVLSSVSVSVTEVNNIAKTVLDLVKLSSDATRSEDNNLDTFADSTVVYRLNNYTTENVLNGSVDLNAGAYTVEFNPAYVSVTTSPGGSAVSTTPVRDGLVSVAVPSADLNLKAVAKGATDVVVYNAAHIEVGRVRITVGDTTPVLSGVAFKTASTVSYIGKVVAAADVLTLTSSAGDEIVSGITLSAANGHAIRMVDTTSAKAKGTLYIDKDDNGTWTTGDHELGLVDAKPVTGFTNAGTAKTFTISDVTAGYSTVAGDKGTILFTVKDTAGNIVASTTVSVDVK